MQLPSQPMVSCAGVLDRLQGAKLLSTLDVKAAFNNIPLPQHLERYCGIITEDVVLVYTVMAWGFNAAPCHYQWVMNKVMHDTHDVIPRPWEGTYLDDVTAAGSDLPSAWESTLACLWRIALSGQPVNLWKCKLL